MSYAEYQEYRHSDVKKRLDMLREKIEKMGGKELDFSSAIMIQWCIAFAASNAGSNRLERALTNADLIGKRDV